MFQKAKTSIRNILLSFYPTDPLFIDLILTPLHDSSYFPSLSKWHKNLLKKTSIPCTNMFSPFYGLSKSTPPSPPSTQSHTFYLNKSNIDTYFTLLFSEPFTASTPSSLRTKLSILFNIPFLTELSFISNEDNNITSILPVNFYSFAIVLRTLMEIHGNDIHKYSLGVFDTLFIYDNLFYSDLFCFSLLFLYFYAQSCKNAKVLNLNFMKNPQVYANFIFKLEDASDKFLQSKMLSKKERDSVDIFTILNDIIEFKNIANLEISILFNMDRKNPQNVALVSDLEKFIYAQKQINKFEIFADNHFYKQFSVLRINTQNITLHVLDNEEIEFIFNKKDTRISTVTKVSVHGKELKLNNNIPPFLTKTIKELEYITTCFLYDGFSVLPETLYSMSKLKQLTIRPISFDFFYEIFNLQSLDELSQLTKLDLEICSKDSTSRHNNKLDILKIIDNIIIKMPNLHLMRIKLDNTQHNNMKEHYFLTKENAFYFIDKAMRKLPQCYLFSLTNHNDNNETYTKHSKKDEYSLDKLDNTVTWSNMNKMVVFSSSDFIRGNENDEETIEDAVVKRKPIYETKYFLPLLYVINMKTKKLKRKPILQTLHDMLVSKKGTMFLVGDYNN